MQRLLGLLIVLVTVPFIVMCASSGVIGDANELDAAPSPSDPPAAFTDPDAAAPDGDSSAACSGLACNMVDILFVVDNSISMASAQGGLKQAFPNFLTQIKTQLTNTDFHLMVVDTDGAGNEGTCARYCPALDAGAVLGPEMGICAGFNCASLTERTMCDSTIGAGATYPSGTHASNRNCNFPEGRRYLTSKDENLEELFLCSAAVGTLGDGNERPISAMFSALEVETKKGGCSEGFLRDDALLVVVIVSDAGSTAAELDSAEVQAWRQRLLALKCGREEGVVLMAVTHDGTQTAPWYSAMIYQEDMVSQWNDYCTLVPNDGCCCQTKCPDPMDIDCFPDPRPRPCAACAGQAPPWKACWFYFTGYGVPLVRLAESFGERGQHREICDDFSDVLDDTLKAVNKACAVF